jgi:iron complex outermembrane recepter protein
MSPKGTHSIRLAIVIATLLGAHGQVHAQSTASQILEEVTVSGERVDEGLIREETAAKSRSTVGQEYFQTQSAGQTVFQSINLVPGVNFVNSDPYGSSGGNIRLRGFDGNRIALLSDGIPLNDTGNYSIFTNQQLDSEIVDRVTVNLGTTDVDSPTAAATGGTINLVTNIPKDEFSGMVKASWGEDSYNRYFLRADTGEFGPWKTKAFFTSSWQQYDKFKGAGDLEKRQINGRIYQDLGDGDFVSLAFHGNRNRNNFVRNLSKAQIARSGFDFDNLDTCLRAGSGAGVQNDNAIDQGDPDGSRSCTNYFNVRRNPTDTANIRGQASIGLTESLRWTFDPNFQYVLANGGGYTTFAEGEGRLRGASAALGADLNGDGDVVDTIGLYAPNNTMTRRYGLTTSLIWEIDETSTLRVGYTLDYGKHRQTGEYGPLDANGNPLSSFAGRDGPSVSTAEGGPLRLRDRLSIARLNQASLSYTTQLFDDRIGLNVGVRAPFFRRELNQFCFTQVSGSNADGNPGIGNPLCTTEIPSTAPAADGTVQFAGRGTRQFLQPFAETVKFDELLPNISVSYAPTDASQLYLSFAKGFAAPRTDNLYTNAIDLEGVKGEETDTLEVGYRYQTGRITATSALWSTKVSDRIVSAFDQDLGINVDRNVGDVDMVGLDAAIGSEIFAGFSGYLTASYIDSEIKSDAPFNTTMLLPTRGKELVETPEYTLGARFEYRLGGFSTGLQGKFVDERFATDVNDEIAPSYKVFDLDARYEFKMFGTSSYVQVNVNNMFDEEYLGNISSRFSGTIGQFGTTATNGPQYSIGAPRTVQLTVETQF